MAKFSFPLLHTGKFYNGVMDIKNYKTEEKGYTSYITYDKIHVIFEFWPSIELEEIE